MPTQSFLVSWAIQSQVCLWLNLSDRFYQAEQYNLRDTTKNVLLSWLETIEEA
jgi:hypothetical protein